MPNDTLKIMCVHGLGDHRQSIWEHSWSDAILRAFPATPNVEPHCEFVTYDDIFEDTDIDGWEAAEAFWKLAKSGIGALGRRRGALQTISKKIRWTAGYVVAWLEDETFQQRTRERIYENILNIQPDVLVAHSLGSLITFNAMTHEESQRGDISAAIRKLRYVTVGSQLANPFVVRNLTPGRISPPEVKYWRHFYNRHDDVFTAPISLYTPFDFEQVETPFDTPGVGDHAAEEYLTHPNAIEEFWVPVAEEVVKPTPFGPTAKSFSWPNQPKKRRQIKRNGQRRAILIGINEYPNPDDRLEGCVNDVFLMSSILQECGFEAEDIRVCLDHRATKDGILERLDWLLDDPQADDQRVFYFSGHGTRIPVYGDRMEPDRFIEALVPVDFEWTEDSAITDTTILGRYSQLPYDLRLAMIFDCCHSGGVHKSGGATIRGISPPDDIRHRELKWDMKQNVWIPRDFKPLDDAMDRRTSFVTDVFGARGDTVRLGRASALRGQLSEKDYDALKARSSGPVGPYLPLILEACQENEFAYEYRHGVQSFGAFTYKLASNLRLQSKKRNLTFKALLDKTKKDLLTLGYDQIPQIVAPSFIQEAVIPWKSDFVQTHKA